MPMKYEKQFTICEKTEAKYKNHIKIFHLQNQNQKWDSISEIIFFEYGIVM
jgi:uncharacterized Rmd1/YagE family protein